MKCHDLVKVPAFGKAPARGAGTHRIEGTHKRKAPIKDRHLLGEEHPPAVTVIIRNRV